MEHNAQTEFEFPVPRTWGGRRKRAGRRKRTEGVAHASRERVTPHDPRLVTLKCAKGLPMLRDYRAARTIVECIGLAHTSWFRVVHYSIQSNHVHLIVEAADAAGLAGGMKGLVSRVARALNKLWSRRGSMFPRRFHDIVLRSLRQVRNALRYVLNNHLKHGSPVLRDGAAVEPDPFSSARYFDGWADRAPEVQAGRAGALVAAGGWSLSVGWMRHYRLIGVAEVPGVRCEFLAT